MTDLPARLRACVTLSSAYKLMDEAASELERLNAERETYRRANIIAEDKQNALLALLAELVDGDHIYGNDAERVLVKIETALGRA